MRLTRFMPDRYSTVPLRWGFEQGTLAPFWMLMTPGNMPTLAVTRNCFLGPHSGLYQLCSAYPWPRRNTTHGLLHVQSAPFVLGAGELSWQMNGGDITTKDLPAGTLDMAINGLGALGVALSRASDGYRVLTTRAHSGKYWTTERWTAAQLAPYVGEKMTLDVYDYRSGPWAWLAVDTFVIPAAWVQIYSISPSGGSSDGETTITIVGSNFGSTTDGLTVFVHNAVCSSLRMVARNTLTCVVGPDPTCAPETVAYQTQKCWGLTVSVVLGYRNQSISTGPFGGYQAGHCGSESAAYPFSLCVGIDTVQLPTVNGIAQPVLRGFSFRAPPKFNPANLPCTDPTARTAASLLVNGTVTCRVYATQDVPFTYSPNATQQDKYEVTFSAGPLPPFLSFDAGDPATGVAPALAGTPLVADATCPFGQSCPLGVPYTIVIYATDSLVTVNITFTLLVVSPAQSGLATSTAQEFSIPAAPSPAFTFASAAEWTALITQTLSAGSFARSANALAARAVPGGPDAPSGGQMASDTFLSRPAVDDDLAFDAPLDGRDPVESAFLAALSASLAAPRVNASAAALLLGASALGNGPGVAAATGTLSSALRLALRLQSATDAAQRDAAYHASIATAGDWFSALGDAINALILPVLSPSSSVPPLSMYVPTALGPDVQPVQVMSYALNGLTVPVTKLFAVPPTPGALPVATPPGSAVASVVIPTLCAPSPASGNATTPFNISFGTPSSSPPSLLAPCDQLPALGVAAAHTLWISYPEGVSLRPIDMALDPANDVPHADLLSTALATTDVATCVWALADRIAAHAARRRDIAALASAFNVSWSPVSSTLSVTFATPLPAPAPPLVATLDIDNAFPIPPTGSTGGGVVDWKSQAVWQPMPPVRLLRLDGLPWHGDLALSAIGAMLDVLPADTPLSARLATLQAAAQTFAKRCPSDCSGRGICVWNTTYPPSCNCVAGATGSTCAATRCAMDCNGRGVCDSAPVCTTDTETGQTTCLGGTGLCACYAPWGGSLCDSRDCPSAYLIIDKQYPANLSASAIKALYTAQGWSIDNVWQSNYDGVPWAAGAVAGDQYTQANPNGSTSVAVVRFFRSEQAAAARAQLEAARPSIPSRGVALLAASFLTQYRGLAERQRYLLNYFGVPNAPCSASGICNGTVGACTCSNNAAGAACELRTCPSGCGGHGTCNTATGTCTCDALYVTDSKLGCAVASLGMASTTCEDAARDGRTAGNGTRLSPLPLSCLLGVPLGTVTAAGWCPPALSSYLSTTAALCYTSGISAGSSLCADCSGYAPANVSMLHIAADASLYAPNTAVSGIGALPNSSITFQLSTLRQLGLPFSAFIARPGIVRRWAACDCAAANSYCGASFAVLVDGQPAWKATLADGTSLRVDVSNAKTLTLVTTSSPPPTDWRFSGTNYSAGNGLAPGVASAPQRAVFCDGAAWAQASLI